MRFIFVFAFIFNLAICHSQTLKVVKMEISPLDIEARTSPRLDNNGTAGALIKIQLPEDGATFETPLGILGDVADNNGEYWVYIPDKTKQITIKLPKSLPITVYFADYNIKWLESKTNYILQVVVNQEGISHFKRNCLYAEPKFQLGGLTAFGVSIGGFKNHLNVELSYLVGLSRSEEIFWNNSSIEDSSLHSYTYKSTQMEGKIGYAFYIGKPFRVTPQFGLGVVGLNGTEKQIGTSGFDAKDGYALNTSISVRLDYLILPWLGVGFSPEYSLVLSKSDMFERVSDVSSKIDGFSKGFNVKLGLFITI